MLVPYATVALILHQDFTLRSGEKVCTAAGTCRLGGNDTVLRTLDFFGREKSLNDAKILSHMNTRRSCL